MFSKYDVTVQCEEVYLDEPTIERDEPSPEEVLLLHFNRALKLTEAAMAPQENEARPY